MTNTITVTGLVATDPRFTVTTEDNIATIAFRLASLSRKFDPSTSSWEVSATNWYSILATGGLARNIEASIAKGDRIIVTGDLRVRDWDNGQHSGTTIEIAVTVIGHDLNYGRTVFNRLPDATETATMAHNCDCDRHND